MVKRAGICMVGEKVRANNLSGDFEGGDFFRGGGVAGLGVG